MACLPVIKVSIFLDTVFMKSNKRGKTQVPNLGENLTSTTVIIHEGQSVTTGTTELRNKIQ